ncbi:hypothetical protein HY637_02615 [Candidatus Woesearchaeota archaeon]|nr:hypothetical protein [Candidatus Woesearchaeota archaeon]
MNIISIVRIPKQYVEAYFERVSPAIILAGPDSLSTDANRNAPLDRKVSYAGFDDRGNEWLLRATEQYPVTVVSAVSRQFNRPVTLMVKGGSYDHWVSKAFRMDILLNKSP